MSSLLIWLGNARRTSRYANRRRGVGRFHATSSIVSGRGARMPTIDLNSDLGESFGAWRIGYDDALFPMLSSANVACGFHGGDPRTLERTIEACQRHGVAVGAHPGFPDLVGFGRRQIICTPDEIRTDTLYQLGALDAFCRVAGVRMQHVKPHGA